MAESHWEAKLKVLEWQDELARRPGIYAARSGGARRGTGGALDDDGEPDCPFATVGNKVGGRRHRLGWILPTVEEFDIRGARLIGE